MSELHLGRLPEAEAALQQALSLDPKNPDALANTIVLYTILGKDTEETKVELAKVDPNHPFLTDVAAKKDAFAAAQAKYTPKFEV